MSDNNAVTPGTGSWFISRRIVSLNDPLTPSPWSIILFLFQKEEDLFRAIYVLYVNAAIKVKAINMIQMD